MNILEWINNIKLYKINNFISYNDVFLILEYVFKKKRIWILSNIFFKINNYQLGILNFFFIKRLRGEPIYYIIGRGFFRNIVYKIYPDVFIPRFDTELMVHYAVNIIKLNNFFNILDLGTGSGVIALSIAKSCNNVFVTGVDTNISCINLAKYNSYFLNIKNVFFVVSNWFSYFKNKKKKFDLIISNPPYINNNDVCLNISNDLRFESYFSLFSRFNGILDIMLIIYNSFYYLNNKGWLILEHSHLHKDIVKHIFLKKFYNVFSFRDYNNLYRFTIGQKNIF